MTPPSHRDDIQGLRAVAVVLVVLGHAGVAFLPGGFIGVDVFFVLSGILITGLLLSDAVRRGGSVSFVHFYARRARRILPAAALTLVVTDVVAYQLLNFVRAKVVVEDSIWASLFAANIHFAQIGTDYFARGQPPSPVQHFWSLAVEEQFYLVWPALLAAALLAAARRRRSRPTPHPIAQAPHPIARTPQPIAATSLAPGGPAEPPGARTGLGGPAALVAAILLGSLAWSIYYTPGSGRRLLLHLRPRLGARLRRRPRPRRQPPAPRLARRPPRRRLGRPGRDRGRGRCLLRAHGLARLRRPRSGPRRRPGDRRRPRRPAGALERRTAARPTRPRSSPRRSATAPTPSTSGTGRSS